MQAKISSYVRMNVQFEPVLAVRSIAAYGEIVFPQCCG